MTIPAFNAPLRYYAVSVANSGRVSLRWSPPFASAKEAIAHGRAKVEAGDATLAAVVRAGAKGREVLAESIWPQTARRIVGHWLEMVAACEEGRAT